MHVTLVLIAVLCAQLASAITVEPSVIAADDLLAFPDSFLDLTVTASPSDFITFPTTASDDNTARFLSQLDIRVEEANSGALQPFGLATYLGSLVDTHQIGAATAEGGSDNENVALLSGGYIKLHTATNFTVRLRVGAAPLLNVWLPQRLVVAVGRLLSARTDDIPTTAFTAAVEVRPTTAVAAPAVYEAVAVPLAVVALASQLLLPSLIDVAPLALAVHEPCAIVDQRGSYEPLQYTVFFAGGAAAVDRAVRACSCIGAALGFVAIAASVISWCLPLRLAPVARSAAPLLATQIVMLFAPSLLHLIGAMLSARASQTQVFGGAILILSFLAGVGFVGWAMLGDRRWCFVLSEQLLFGSQHLRRTSKLPQPVSPFAIYTQGEWFNSRYAVFLGRGTAASPLRVFLLDRVLLPREHSFSARIHVGAAAVGALAALLLALQGLQVATPEWCLAKGAVLMALSAVIGVATLSLAIYRCPAVTVLTVALRLVSAPAFVVARLDPSPAQRTALASLFGVACVIAAARAGIWASVVVRELRLAVQPASLLRIDQVMAGDDDDDDADDVNNVDGAHEGHDDGEAQADNSGGADHQQQEEEVANRASHVPEQAVPAVAAPVTTAVAAADPLETATATVPTTVADDPDEPVFLRHAARTKPRARDGDRLPVGRAPLWFPKERPFVRSDALPLVDDLSRDTLLRELGVVAFLEQRESEPPPS